MLIKGQKCHVEVSFPRFIQLWGMPTSRAQEQARFARNRVKSGLANWLWNFQMVKLFKVHPSCCQSWRSIEQLWHCEGTEGAEVEWQVLPVALTAHGRGTGGTGRTVEESSVSHSVVRRTHLPCNFDREDWRTKRWSTKYSHCHQLLMLNINSIHASLIGQILTASWTRQADGDFDVYLMENGVSWPSLVIVGSVTG